MIADIERRVDDLWQTFRRIGVSNPLDIVEQVTSLMFVEFAIESKYPNFLYNSIENLPYERIRDRVFPSLQHGEWLGDPAWFEDAVLKVPSAEAWTEVQKSFMAIDWENGDVRRIAYEYLLELLLKRDREFLHVPPFVSRLMAGLANPLQSERVCDLACDIGDTLLSMAEHAGSSSLLLGCEEDRTLIRIAAMNLLVHGAEFALRRIDVLRASAELDRSTVVVARLPFSGKTQEAPSDLQLGFYTDRKELLALDRIITSTRRGARCVCLVPEGVLFGASRAHKLLRSELMQKATNIGIVKLPKGWLLPRSGIAASLLVFDMGSGDNDGVWFYDRSFGELARNEMEAVKWEIAADATERYHAWRKEGVNSEEAQRLRSEWSFVVSSEEIWNNECNLSIGRYREIEDDFADLPSPTNLFKSIGDLEARIHESLEELSALMK